MKMTITNTSARNEGVHGVAKMEYLGPGETRDIDVAENYVDRVKALPFFKVATDTAKATKK